MGNISFRSDFLSPESVRYKQSLRKSVVETGTGRKSVSPHSITAQAGADKEENDRLLRKVQFAQTKSDAMREYLGTMQEAVRDSGSNGFYMLRRISHMSVTGNAYQQTPQFLEKKDTDTFLLDQLEALQKRQEEMKELQDVQEKKQQRQQNKAESTDNEQKNAGSEPLGKRETSPQRNSSKNTSNVKNADLQKKAAGAYKSKDAPSRNPYVQQFFTGMM